MSTVGYPCNHRGCNCPGGPFRITTAPNFTWKVMDCSQCGHSFANHTNPPSSVPDPSPAPPTVFPLRALQFRERTPRPARPTGNPPVITPAPSPIPKHSEPDLDRETIVNTYTEHDHTDNTPRPVVTAHALQTSTHHTQRISIKRKREETPPKQIITPAAIIYPGRSPPMPLDENICRREITVANLMKRLLTNSVVLVRGTPASGKSTLLRCCYAYLEDQPRSQPLANTPQVFRIASWDRDRVDQIGGWKAYIFHQTDGYLDLSKPIQDPYILFIDEAQTSYWDTAFWSEYIKAITLDQIAVKIHHVLLFASYGSDVTNEMNIHQATPTYLTTHQLVGLRPEPLDPVSVGLLLQREEFEDTVIRHMRGIDCKIIDVNDKDACQLLFDITQGHAGALISLLDSLSRYHPFQKYVRNRIPLTAQQLELEYFSTLQESFADLSKTSFCRGLPRASELHKPIVASIFEEALFAKCITKEQADSWDSTRRDALVRCHHKGWLHLYQPDPNTTNGTAYVLPSKLHEWYLASMLGTISPSIGLESYSSPLELSIAAIKKFRTTALQATQAAFDSLNPPTLIGPSTAHRPREAVYQDEFYRSIYMLLNGKVTAIPEWGEGRIDFFIAHTRWGIELVRDGRDLEKHLARFRKGGHYNPWLKEGKMKDYIVLNFQGIGSVCRFPNLGGKRKLYHVVFSDDYRCVKIMDCQGEEVMELTRLLK